MPGPICSPSLERLNTCELQVFLLMRKYSEELLAAVPAVNISAAVSPTIRPVASMTPDKIPGIALGRTDPKYCS